DGRCRALREGETGSPFADGTDRARLEPATTVRAHVGEDGVDAGRAKRALIGADAGRGRVGWEVDVALLAVRTKLEGHRVVPFSREEPFGGWNDRRSTRPRPSVARGRLRG